jgi:starch synthase
VWIEEQADRGTLIQLLTHALTFVCPSVYEPLGIVNLEAMACQTAVVASAVGGIPEVVVDGETGVLVPYDPADASGLEAGLAEAVNSLARDPQRAAAFGVAGRARAVADFGWDAIAQETVAVYRTALRS